MQKRIITCAILLAAICAGQTAGTVDVQTTITATAGPVQCVITPGTGGQSANLTCKKGTVTVAVITQTPAIDASGVLVSIAAPITATTSDAVTVLLKKTTATALVTWEAAANGVLKSGTF